jgi:hypothetical protein
MARTVFVSGSDRAARTARRAMSPPCSFPLEITGFRKTRSCLTVSPRVGNTF